MKKSTLAAALAAIALAACTGAPSDAEAKGALLAQAAAFGGASAVRMFEGEMKGFRLTSCARTDAGAYRCDYVGGPLGAGVGKFARGSDGWTWIGGGD